MWAASALHSAQATASQSLFSPWYEPAKSISLSAVREGVEQSREVLVVVMVCLLSLSGSEGVRGGHPMTAVG